MNKNNLKEKMIYGFQQIGIGTPDNPKSFEWYRKNLGFDISVFEESAEAPLMTKYTGGKVQSRKATLALNLNGGSGFEIWQFTSRKSEKANFDIQLGDLGINICKIKSKNVSQSFSELSNKNVEIISTIETAPNKKKHFFIKDLFGNIFQIVESDDWFSDTKFLTGGFSGVIIGVSDIEKSLKLYSDILGFKEIVYDKSGYFEDLKELSSGNKKFRRILLNSTFDTGGFSKLFGAGQIELIQSLERKPEKIFKNRFWGDQGFIHLCFDVKGMNLLKKECAEKEFPFTVDSEGAFEMENASGHFTYIEDPDGTLIEFVEAHKLPIIEKFGWNLNLNKRNPHKTLPNFIIKALKFSRIKD
ncbi:MAG: VOC family protein [Candidatus Marinimicrobia bacterium]|nr:VOC family protein [Candidatus Neomarinimicrobiota bacterium]